MPRVSIIIPAYNPGDLIDVAAESVIGQTYEDWELVIVDDGGSEDLSRLSEKHPAIRVIRQPNRGTSAARNTGVLRSSGELIAFLDQDDFWLSSKLMRQVEAMDNDKSIGLCYTNFFIVDDRNGTSTKGYSSPMTSYVDLLEKNGGPCLSTVLVRRDCLMVSGLFDPFYPGIQDYDLFLKIAAFYPLKYLPSCEVSYRLHGGNVSGDYKLIYNEIVNVAEKHRIRAEHQKNWEAVRAVRQMLENARPTYAAKAFDRARSGFRAGRMLEFWIDLGNAVRISPAVVMRSLVHRLCAPQGYSITGRIGKGKLTRDSSERSGSL